MIINLRNVPFGGLRHAHERRMKVLREERRAAGLDQPAMGRRRSAVPVKAAGADLKRHYAATLQLGFAASLLIAVGFVHAPIERARPTGFSLTDQELVQIEDIHQTKHLETPPPPPAPRVPVAVADETILEEDELDLDASLDLETTLVLPTPPPLAEATEEEEENEIFVIVEQMPQIVGGTEALYKLIRYPEIAIKAGMEGVVVVKVVVEPDGSPTSPEILRSAGDVLDKAAQAAVMQLQFVPGKQRSRPVRVNFSIPVIFRLGKS